MKERVLGPGALQYLEVKGLKKKSAKENKEKSVKQEKNQEKVVCWKLNEEFPEG